MKYTTETKLRDFNAWSGGKDTLQRLKELGECEKVEQYIDDCMPDATDMDINDFLWFETDYIAVDILGFDSVDAFYSDEEINEGE